MGAIGIPSVDVTLGGETRTLSLGFAQAWRFEQQTGKNLIAAFMGGGLPLVSVLAFVQAAMDLGPGEKAWSLKRLTNALDQSPQDFGPLVEKTAELIKKFADKIETKDDEAARPPGPALVAPAKPMGSIGTG